MPLYDPAPDRGPLTPGERWAFGVILLIVLGLFLTEVVTDFHPAKLSALLVAVLWLPMIGVHESGHALMAAGLGWHVDRVVVGFGRPFWRFRAGTAVVEVCVLPISGYVLSAPTNLRAARVKSALIYFAGPGIELAVAALLALLIGPDQFFSRSENYGLIFCQSLALTGTIQAVLNLFPYPVEKRGEQPGVSDGLGIIKSFTRPWEDYEVMLRLPGPDDDLPFGDPGRWWDRER